ncbi:M56 family metallopeptidase [Hydrotalea sp.]|uniref:M56 family metallopeptidase n=1 Tax=Hydrotalea sp. TaxID=2881279 RepID=UPI003D0FB7A9
MSGYQSFLIHLGNAIIWNLFIGAILWFLYVLIKQLLPNKVIFHFNFSFAALILLGLFFITASVYFYFNSKDLNPPYLDEISEFSIAQNLAWPKTVIQSYIIYCLSVIYIIGLLWQIIKWPFILKHKKKLYSIINHQVPETIHLFIEKQKQVLNIQKKVIVYLVQEIVSPVTIGFIKPIILLPVASITNLSTAAIEAILVHELAHIRRNDYLINFIAKILQSILFFNPFVNFLLREMNTSREIICDQYVLQQQYSPMFYANSLLQLSKLSNIQLSPVLSMPAVQNKGVLLLRIQHIVQFDKMPKPVSILHNAKIFMAGFYVLLAMAIFYFITFNVSFKNTVDYSKNKNREILAATNIASVIPLQSAASRPTKILAPQKQLLASKKKPNPVRLKSINPIIDKVIESNQDEVNTNNNSQDLSFIPVKQLLSSAINEDEAIQSSFKIKQISDIHYNHSTIGYRMYFIQKVDKQTHTTEPYGYIMEVQKQLPGIDGEVHIVRDYYWHLYPNNEIKLKPIVPVITDSTIMNNVFN